MPAEYGKKVSFHRLCELEAVLNESQPGKPDELKNWQENEIYIGSFLWEPKRGQEVRKTAAPYQFKVCTYLNERKFVLHKEKSIADFGCDYYFVTKNGLVLLEIKEDTWKYGPPLLLLSGWLKIIKTNILNKIGKDSEAKSTRVFLVAPFEKDSVWKHPTLEEIVELMSLDGLNALLEREKLQPGDTKDFEKYAKQLKHIPSDKDKLTEQRLAEVGGDSSRDTFEIGLDGGIPYVKINNKTVPNLQERIFADLVYLAAAKKYRKGDEQWVHKDDELLLVIPQETNDIRNFLQKGHYKNQLGNLDLIQVGRLVGRTGKVLLWFSPESITIDKSVCDFVPGKFQYVAKTIDLVYRKWGLEYKNSDKEQLLDKFIKFARVEKIKDFTDTCEFVNRYIKLVRSALKITNWKFHNEKWNSNWDTTVKQYVEIMSYWGISHDLII